MMFSLVFFFFNLIYLIRAPITNLQKRKILWAYLAITLRKILIQLHLQKDSHKINFLNFSIYHPYAYSYYNLFGEIFLQNMYFFKTEKKIPLILDCGANIGLAMFYFKYLYPKAHIKCFEPNPEALELLKKNIKENHLSNIFVYPKALSDGMEEKRFYNPSGILACASAGFFINRTHKGDFSEKKVKTNMLSKYINEEIDFLKVDVEGAESQVFKDLDISGKIKYISQAVIEFHLNYFEKEIDLSKLLGVLEKNKLAYHLHAIAVPLYQPDKIQDLMIYARKNKTA